MPAIIKTLDQIMRERRSDVYVLRFNRFEIEMAAEMQRLRQEHLNWFEKHNIAYEVAAPTGWLEGDPACYAVYFDGNDARIAAYSVVFEDGTGRSVQPRLYQMYLHRRDVGSSQEGQKAL